MKAKIGLGLITYNAPEKLKQSAVTVPDLDHFVIVNDGMPYDPSIYPKNAHIIQHDKNYGVAKAKNDAFRYLLAQGCEHIFIMEDDILIKNACAIEKYIIASEISGILHLNYALQGPHNRKQKKNIWQKIAKKINSEENSIDPLDRERFDENSTPDPRMIQKYDKDVSIALYRNCVGAFSYYKRETLAKAGLMDEHFKNAWEHVEHTYQIIKAGYHPPFWWFADIANSESYIDNIENCMANSSIANSENWKRNVIEGEKYFEQKEGFKISQSPDSKKASVISCLKELKQKNGIK